MNAELRIVVDGAHLQFVYDDALVSLLDEGATRVRRVSHVEPTDSGQWTADMSPVDGPVLGPFVLRADALQAERDWLREHLGL